MSQPQATVDVNHLSLGSIPIGLTQANVAKHRKDLGSWELRKRRAWRAETSITCLMPIGMLGSTATDNDGVPSPSAFAGKSALPSMTTDYARSNQYASYQDAANEAQALSTELSLIIPICNEVGTIDSLHEQLTASLTAIGRSYEIIYIDDGSTDGSYEKLETIWSQDPKVRVIKFARNFGKTAAMSAALDCARGEIMIPMDADLQNDPKDIVRLLDKLEEGYDVVSGWRKKRYDELFLRLIPSWIANRLISTMTGVHLRDYGCCLKAYRRAVIQDVRLYGEMHRFVPIYASWHGARVTEIPVIHHPRCFGKSKYGISRTTKVLLDLITVTFMSNYLTKPIYVFGTAGLISLAASFGAFVWMIVIRYGYNTHFTDTPLPVLTAMFFMIGIQFILMGLLAELLMRTYHESQGKRTYVINKLLEHNQETASKNENISFAP